MYIITKLVVHHAYIAVQFYVSRMEDKEIILKYDIDLEDYRIYSVHIIVQCSVQKYIIFLFLDTTVPQEFIFYEFVSNIWHIGGTRYLDSATAALRAIELLPPNTPPH